VFIVICFESQKIDQKSFKNLSKIYQKSINFRPWEGSWGHVGSQRFPGVEIYRILTSPGEARAVPGGCPGDDFFDHFFVHRLGRPLDRFFFDFSSILALFLAPFFEFF